MSIFDKFKKDNLDYVVLNNPTTKRDKELVKNFKTLNDYKQLNNISEFTPIKTDSIPTGEYFILYSCVGYMLYAFDENTPLEKSFINFREKGHYSVTDFTDITNSAEDAFNYKDLEDTIPDGLRDFQMLVVTPENVKFVNKYKVTLQKITNNTINALKSMAKKAQKSNIDIVSGKYTLFGDIINQAYYFCYSDVIHNLIGEKLIKVKSKSGKPEKCLIAKNSKYDIDKVAEILKEIVVDKENLALDAFCKKYEPLSLTLMPEHIRPEVKIKKIEQKPEDLEKQKLLQIKQLSNQEKLRKLNIFDESFQQKLEKSEKNQTMKTNIDMILNSENLKSELDDFQPDSPSANKKESMDNQKVDPSDLKELDNLLDDLDFDDLEDDDNKKDSNSTQTKKNQTTKSSKSTVPYAKLSPLERIERDLAEKEYTIPQEESNDTSEIFDHSSDIQANKKTNKKN